MTKEETKVILNAIMIAYPNYKPTDIGGTIRLWATMLENVPLKAVEAALKVYITTDRSGFAPSIGQLTGILQDVAAPELTPTEAWSLVRKAIRNGLYGAKEEYEKLPPAVKRAVGSYQNLEAWARVSSDEIETVIQSQFIKAYKSATLQENMTAAIPEKAMAIIQSAMPKLEAQ